MNNNEYFLQSRLGNQRQWRSILAMLFFCVLTGCGYKSGFIRDTNTVHSVQYRINTQAMRFVRTAMASENTGAILCIIPSSWTPLYAVTMQNLYKKANLSKNEILINLREDHVVVSYLFFYCKWQLTISGDIVEVEHNEISSNQRSQRKLSKFPSSNVQTSIPPDEPKTSPRMKDVQQKEPGLIREVELVPMTSPSVKSEPAPRPRAPEEYLVLMSKARLAHVSGSMEMAATYAHQAVEVFPDGDEAHKLLGLLYYLAGEKTKAAKHYREYLRLRPDASDADQIKKMIKLLDNR